MPPLVRSNGANAGSKLPSSSANDGSVGIGDAERELLVQLRRADRAADLHVVRSRRCIATSAFTPMFVSVRSWLTVAGVSANGSALGV